ncbi:MAG: YqgE/AlgH family protein [Opitutaceae bacterium]
MRERSSSGQPSLAGSLLLAHPSLRDGNFRRAVILMTADDPKGSMGVVVNRPLSGTLGGLGGEFALGPLASVPLFHGGPVESERLLLAAWRAQAHGFQVQFGIEAERAAALAADNGAQVRAFYGYAGWGAGQLANELKLHTWLVAEAPPDLFSQAGGPELWRASVGRQGAEWKLLADEPEEPNQN